MKKQYADSSHILNSFENYLAEIGRSENTIKTYCGVIQSYFCWLEAEGKSVKGLEKQDVQQYLDYLQTKQRSPSTIKKVLNTLHTFAKSLGHTHLVKDVQYHEESKNQLPPDCLSADEKDQLLKNIIADGNKRNVAIVQLLLSTGIRVSELCALNITDIKINEKNQTGQLTVSSTRKKMERTMLLSKTVVSYINDYLKSRSDNEEALFLSNYQKRISPRTVQHTLQQYGVHPHILRHTFCYDLIRKGMDLSIVQQLAGHSNIHVTKQYVTERSDKKHA
ncbi:tyrosine-type recombinase/integrase [Bacillus shivajii]|uniref:tyrosine-type recombinase/integrase n=1 Tax=Bacillus shivajii TaxID=1983719 RepID=UPI001CFB8728|nr:tyrosine-type recombinase/integrase [Bacillus shivajii]UCZ52132.1 tyrosine-type recombinase/integrase [Bacillus shivajii]